MSKEFDALWASVRGKQWPKYEGELTKGIDVNAEEDLLDAFLRKCRALAQFYGLESEPTPDNFVRLFLCLASHHVPGFRFRKPRKTPANKKWTDERLEELFTDVETIKSQKGFKQDRQAYDYIVGTRAYSAKWQKVFTRTDSREKMKESLESRFQQAKNMREKREVFYRQALAAALMKPIPDERS
jgi:hypothetical protein